MEHFLSRISYAISALIVALGGVAFHALATVIGIVLGVLTYRLNRRHKARVEFEEHARTELLRERVELLRTAQQDRQQGCAGD